MTPNGDKSRVKLTGRPGRDDFPAPVKEQLAKRVGFKCSNPECRHVTSGPQLGSGGTVNIGVAAHIAGASAGGPRFDPSMTREQRMSIDNAIWLCFSCSKLVDSDLVRFTRPRLTAWRVGAESQAATELRSRRSPPAEHAAVFFEAERLMPKLIEEMRVDVLSDESELVRVCYLAPTSGAVLTFDGEFFRYDKDKYRGLQHQFDWLEEMGLVTQVGYGVVPGYRLTPAFHAWLGQRPG